MGALCEPAAGGSAGRDDERELLAESEPAERGGSVAVVPIAVGFFGRLVKKRRLERGGCRAALRKMWSWVARGRWEDQQLKLAAGVAGAARRRAAVG